MKYIVTLSIIGLLTVLSGNYTSNQDSVYINGQEYRPVFNDYNNMGRDYYSPPKEDCWYEQIPIADESPDIGGAIVGGIIGGVIGHQFGGGSGKTAATIGGAALGTALGSTPQPAVRYKTVRKCGIIR